MVKAGDLRSAPRRGPETHAEQHNPAVAGLLTVPHTETYGRRCRRGPETHAEQELEGATSRLWLEVF
jgi:hypothetical protein